MIVVDVVRLLYNARDHLYNDGQWGGRAWKAPKTGHFDGEIPVYLGWDRDEVMKK